MSIITLTTDFGLQDWFVGTMKGVILGIQPKAQLVDITHQIAPGDIASAAFALASSSAFFPPGTVHLVVVDPGVGSDRPAIAVQTRRYRFVGPDNGVLSLAAAQDGPRAVHRLENTRFSLGKVSRTFHGRDIFAPVAAYLSKGLTVSRLGPKQAHWVKLSLPDPVEQGGGWAGAVVYIDRFGNAITNLPEELPVLHDRRAEVRLAGKNATVPVRECYQAAGKGKALAVAGSSGFLEIAVNGGSAARKLRLKPGDPVWVGVGREPNR